MKSKAIVTLFIIVVAASTACAAVQESRYVEVLGTVERQIPSDRAFMIAEISAKRESAAEARSGAEAVRTAISSMLAKHALPSDAIIFSNPRTEPEYDYSGGKRVFSEYKVTIRLSLRLDDMRVLAAIEEFESDAGDFRIIWVDLSSTREGEYRKAGLSEAFAHARAKAEALAQQAGRSLGGVEFVREEEAEMRSSGGDVAMNSADPYEGKGIYPIRIYIRIRVRFEMQDK